jgi:hypothetical protein
MGTWNRNNPCKNCGNTNGQMVKCGNCGTLGCYKCVEQPGGSRVCKVCKKRAKIDRI